MPYLSHGPVFREVGEHEPRRCPLHQAALAPQGEVGQVICDAMRLLYDLPDQRSLPQAPLGEVTTLRVEVVVRDGGSLGEEFRHAAQRSGTP